MTNPTKEDKRKKPYEAQSYSAGMKQGKKETLEDELKFLEEEGHNDRIEDCVNCKRFTEIKKRLEELK